MAAAPLPTEAELEILRVLWDNGPSTVRDVHERVGRRRAVGYTTVLKLMQIMLEKRLVERDTGQRSHVYTARVARGATQGALVSDLLERAFGGSAAALVQRALESSPASASELAEIRRMIEERER